MRTIKKVYCSCSLLSTFIDDDFDPDEVLSSVTEIDTTKLENLKLGCRREGCCVNVFRCSNCGTRFIFQLEAPEARDE